MFQTKVVEKIKTHILYSVTFFYEIVPFMRQCGKNIVEWGRSQMAIWRIAYWIPKATEAHSEYVIFIAFPLQKLLHERASIQRYLG